MEERKNLEKWLDSTISCYKKLWKSRSFNGDIENREIEDNIPFRGVRKIALLLDSPLDIVPMQGGITHVSTEYKGVTLYESEYAERI